MTGRKPVPTALKVLRGNPGKRPLPADEPQYPALSADAPVPEVLALSPVAAAEWQRMTGLLDAAGVLTQADEGAVIACCQQWAVYVEASRKVTSAGLVVKGKDGTPMPNPYLAIADKALRACTRLWTELGCTPTSRTRVQARPKAETQSKWAGLLT